MTTRYAPHLLALLLTSTTLIGCSSGGGDSTPTTPSYTVTTSLFGGTATPANPSVKQGDSVDITLNADNGYTLDAASVTGCDGVLNGNIYTTGAVTVGCTVTASFTKNPGYAPVTLGYGIKQLKFAWPAVSGASYYQLQEQATSGAGFNPVSGQLTDLSAAHDIPVHLHDWINASYMVTAYNDNGEYIDSNVVTTTLTEAVNAIGYVKASNTGLDDDFGYGLALSGDGRTLAVGADYEDSNGTGINGAQDNDDAPDAGAVYVYTLGADGVWSQQAYIKGADTAAGDLFGYTVALSDNGTVMAVGAPGHDGGGVSDAGAVYLFTRTDGTWSQQTPKLISDSPVASGKFGGVTLSDDGLTLAVTERGTQIAYVYIQDGGSWSRQGSMTGSNTEVGDLFGWARALSGDGNTLVIGAGREAGSATTIDGSDNDLAPNAGAAYVFARDAGGIWSQQAYIKAPNAETEDYFGSSTALSYDGNTLVVGAYGEDGDDANPITDAGAVYAFIRDAGGVWSYQAIVRAGSPKSIDSFGGGIAALSSDGDLLAVPAAYDNSNATGIGGDATDTSVPSAGAVYLFKRSNGSWSQQAYVKAPNPGTGDFFGGSVMSNDGNTLAVMAFGESSIATGVCSTAVQTCRDAQADNSAQYAGAVYLY